jgi:hypothetical protein
VDVVNYIKRASVYVGIFRGSWKSLLYYHTPPDRIVFTRLLTILTST